MHRNEVLDRLNEGDPSGAIALIERMLGSEPDDPDLLGLKGIALADSGDMGGAALALRNALELPGETAIRLRNAANLAGLLLETGDWAAAAELLRQDWRWPHDNPPGGNEMACLVRLAEVMEPLGLHAEIVALLSPLAARAAPGWSVLKPLLTALARTGAAERALQMLEAYGAADALAHERHALHAHLLYATGKPVEAVEARDAYLACVPPVILPRRASHELTIGLIDNPPSKTNLLRPWPQAYFTINYPAQIVRSLSDRCRMAALFYRAGEHAIDRFRSCQPDVVINNVTNAEYLQTGDNLKDVEAFIARIAPRVINPPSAAINCTRQKNPEKLAGIDGLILPSIQRFLCDLSRLDELVAQIEAGTDYPMIVRTVYEQEAQNMLLVHNRAELAEAIRKLGKAQIYIVEYIGQPREYGFFRRMRSFFVSGQPIVLWVDYAPKWIVQSRGKIDLQTYRDHPDLLQKANAMIRDPRGELGDKAVKALEAVGRKIPLDIFGMDFDVDDDGNVVFFETNATMRMQVPVPEAFAYPPEATENLLAALSRLFHRFAAARN